MNTNKIVYSDSSIEKHLVCYVEPLEDNKEGIIYECDRENIMDLVGQNGLYKYEDEEAIYISTEYGDYSLSDIEDCKRLKEIGILGSDN